MRSREGAGAGTFQAVLRRHGTRPPPGSARHFVPEIETPLRACGALRRVPILRCHFCERGEGFPPFHTFPPSPGPNPYRRNGSKRRPPAGIAVREAKRNPTQPAKKRAPAGNAGLRPARAALRAAHVATSSIPTARNGLDRTVLRRKDAPGRERRSSDRHRGPQGRGGRVAPVWDGSRVRERRLPVGTSRRSPAAWAGVDRQHHPDFLHVFSLGSDNLTQSVDGWFSSETELVVGRRVPGMNRFVAVAIGICALVGCGGDGAPPTSPPPPTPAPPAAPPPAPVPPTTERTSFGAGTWLVGSDIEPGRYFTNPDGRFTVSCGNRPQPG